MVQCELSPGCLNRGLKQLVNLKPYLVKKVAPSSAQVRELECDAGGKEAATGASQRALPHAVIIVENMTVPPDRRVWQQALALKNSGWRVSMITPKLGSHRKSFEVIEGVNIYRHDLWIEARRILHYPIEYTSALIGEIRLLYKIGLGDIDVVQICNPPDFLFLPALLAKTFGRAKVVFDHHDLTPELLTEKTGKTRGWLMSLAKWAERQTFKTANRVISTNPSFKDRAIELGKKKSDAVCVVYSSPNLERLVEGDVNPELKQGKKNLLFWIGMMGNQDGVDVLLETMVHLRTMPGGDDFHLLIAGEGPERPSLERYARKLGVDDCVTFAGFMSGKDLADAFATADIGVGSDPKNEFNDRLAMNKVMEYMAHRMPAALFDLTECRRIAGDSAFYATNNDPQRLAAQISNLLVSPKMRQTMGDRAYHRLKAEFSWEQQRQEYLNVYTSLINTD